MIVVASASPLGNIVFVERYGAVADDETDNTAAILEARDVAGVGGTVVFRGPGTYQTGAIVANVARQKWLVMAGATVKLKNGVNATAFTGSADGCTLQIDGTLDCNKANQSAGTGVVVSGDDWRVLGSGQILNAKNYGFLGSNAQGLHYRELLVKDSDNIGIFVRSTTEDLYGVDIDANVDRSGVGVGVVGGGVHVRGSDDGVSFVCHAPQVRANVKLPENPTSGSIVCVEVWAKNATVLPCTTRGGAIAVSMGFADGSTTGGHSIKCPSAIGLEVAQSAEVSVGPCQIDGLDSSGVARTLVGVSLDKSSQCAVAPQSIKGIMAGGKIVRIVSSAAKAARRNHVSIGNGETTGASIGVFIQANHVGADCSDNVIGGGILRCDNAVGSRGIVLQRDAGTLNGTVIEASCILDGWDTNIQELSPTGTQLQERLGNVAPATTLGAVTKRLEVFDAEGSSLGFVPIYGTIS